MDIRRPREKRWGSYRSFPEKIHFDKDGNAINPFHEGSSRYKCFDALCKGITLNKFVAGVADEREKRILSDRFKQIETSFFKEDE